MSEQDVFDEDLIRELGLDPEEFKGATPDAPPPPKPKPAPKPAAAAKNPEVHPEPRPAPKRAAPPPKAPSKPAPTAKAPPPQETKPKPTPKPQPQANPDDFVEYAGKMSANIPVQLACVMGKKALKLKDLLQMNAGEVIEFEKKPQELVDLVANGKLVAKAELVTVDGQVGARIVKLVK